MLFQTDLNDAAYLAQIVLSLAGVFVLLIAVLWTIRKIQSKDKTRFSDGSGLPATKAVETTVSYSELNPLTSDQAQTRLAELERVYQSWKKKSLLKSEDNKSAFARCGVEKNGLRYQITTTSQAQAISMLLCTIMAGEDPKSSLLFEALFANLLAHPAYGQANLSSWNNMPDLPRSPKLDPDLHAEAWILFALLAGKQRWPELSRFNYEEIVEDRANSLIEVWKTIDPTTKRLIPDSRYLLSVLKKAQPELGWNTLQEKTQPDFDFELLNLNLTENNQEGLLNPGLVLLQIGMQALLHQDLQAQSWLEENKWQLIDEAEKLISLCQSTQASGSCETVLSCLTPSLLVLQEKELADQIRDILMKAPFEKNAGIASSLRLLSLAFLANKVWFGNVDWSQSLAEKA